MATTQPSTFRGDHIAHKKSDAFFSGEKPGNVEIEDLLNASLLQRINQALSDYQVYQDDLEANIQTLLARLPLIEAPERRGDANEIETDGAEPAMEGKKRVISTGKLSILALPFWLGEAFGVDEEICRRFAVANIFGLLHFVMLDKLVDGDGQASEIPSIAIASSLYLQQLSARYQEFFPPGSPFWQLMEKYWQEWASALVWERDAGPRPLFSTTDLLKTAHKAAPLKICTSGMALLAGRAEIIPDLEAAVDGMHMVMQMMDDLVDMGQDLVKPAQPTDRNSPISERFNAALNMVSSPAGVETKAITDIETIGRHLFTSGQDGDYIVEMERIACNTQSKLRELGLDDWAELIGITAHQARQWRDEHVAWLVAALTA
jgi:hypothetical protein